MAITGNFRKAQRTQCKASIAIEGLSGTGKSGLALSIAYILADKNWSDVFAIDTENKSLDLYVGTTMHTTDSVTPFNIADLSAEDGFKPSYYKLLRDSAIKEGGKVIINDSLSHCWQYEGGVLTMVNKVQNSGTNKNKYAAWGDPEIVQEKNAIMDLVRHRDIHVISTIRTKEKMEILEEDGRKVIRSLGEQQIMMPDFKYEPDLVLQTIKPGSDDGAPPRVKVIKSRYRIFKLDEEYDMTEKLIRQMKEYLEEGTSPEELLEQQKADYVDAVNSYLKGNQTAVTVWKVLLENAGYAGKKSAELPLPVLKQLFGQLVAE